MEKIFKTSKEDDVSSVVDEIYNIMKITNINSNTNSNIILLYGDLGTGKTTLAKKLIHKLTNNYELNVTSPTFNLLKIYENNESDIYHFDLYRLKDENDIYELAIEDAFENISIIEWPEIIEDIIPKNNIIKIYITHEKDDSRLYKLIFS